MKQLTEQIEISKEGIKVSYYRYIAESSVGLLFCGFCFTLKWWSDSSANLSIWEKSFFESIPLEFTIGLFILALLIAPAIGVLISGLAYFTLSWLEVVLLKKLYPFIVWATPMVRYSNDIIRITTSLGITEANFLAEGYGLQRILEYQGSSRIRVNTRRTLTRNFSMLIILCYFLTMISGVAAPAGGLLGLFGTLISVLILTVLATLDLYLQLVLACIVAHSSIESTESEWKGDITKVRKTLADSFQNSSKA